MIVIMILMFMFIDREEEMKKLLEISRSKEAQLVLVYGRRRVGKSTLLVEFAKKTNALYLLADMSENVLDILADQIGDQFVRFKTWDDFFEFIYKSKYKIIIIDEFQYLYQVEKAWPTILQRWWEKIKKTDKKIILCGSIISTIYRIAMGYGSALYGRKTAEMHVKPLKFKFARQFFPKYSIEDTIRTYSVLGGVPRYLEVFDQKLDVETNIKEKVLEKTSFLYNEPFNLLFEEFRSPAPYSSILSAIADGYVKFSEISQASRIHANKLHKYLLILERVGLIEKDIPVTERKTRIRNTRYRIKDNFYRFWFRFVFRNRSEVEQGLVDEVFGSIKKDFNTYVGGCFEDVCREVLLDSGIARPSRIGRWWHKDKEIDIVALDERKKVALFGEAKWKEKVNAEKVLSELVEKAEEIEWDGKKEYVIFAKSFKKRIDEPGVRCMDLKGIEKMVKSER